MRASVSAIILSSSTTNTWVPVPPGILRFLRVSCTYGMCSIEYSARASAGKPYEMSVDCDEGSADAAEGILPKAKPGDYYIEAVVPMGTSSTGYGPIQGGLPGQFSEEGAQEILERARAYLKRTECCTMSGS